MTGLNAQVVILEWLYVTGQSLASGYGRWRYRL